MQRGRWAAGGVLRSGGMRAGRRGAGWELGAYWLLYAVALPAAWLHWIYGNQAIAVACGAVVLLSVGLITQDNTQDKAAHSGG